MLLNIPALFLLYTAIGVTVNECIFIVNIKIIVFMYILHMDYVFCYALLLIPYLFWQVSIGNVYNAIYIMAGLYFTHSYTSVTACIENCQVPKASTDCLVRFILLFPYIHKHLLI